MYLLYQKTPVSSTILAIKSEIISLFIAKLLICYSLCGIIKYISNNIGGINMCEAINENKRAELISTLVENLPVFRAKLGATQDTFAQRVGLTKTTLNHIENYKKELTWGNFITIILLLMQNEETKPLVEVMGLYPEDLKNFLMFQD